MTAIPIGENLPFRPERETTTGSWCWLHGWGYWNCFRVGNCRFSGDDADELLERYAREAESMPRAEIDVAYACLMFNDTARMEAIHQDLNPGERGSFLVGELERLRREQGPLED